MRILLIGIASAITLSTVISCNPYFIKTVYIKDADIYITLERLEYYIYRVYFSNDCNNLKHDYILLKHTGDLPILFAILNSAYKDTIYIKRESATFYNIVQSEYVFKEIVYDNSRNNIEFVNKVKSTTGAI